MDIALLVILLVIFLTFTLPIGISLGLATAITMYFTSDVPLTMIAQSAFTGIDSFPLLAIPFFMLAGSLMGYGGISKRIVGFAECLVGHMIGALAMVTIVACMFFAAISGSGPATVSAIGSFMIPEMKKKLYGGPFSAAISAAAGSIGVIIPPLHSLRYLRRHFRCVGRRDVSSRCRPRHHHRHLAHDLFALFGKKA